MNQEKRTSPWRNLQIVALLPFFGFGCPAAGPVLLRVAVIVGNHLIGTVVGYTVETILDNIFFPSQQKGEKAEVKSEKGEKVGAITINKTNPKKGVYHGTMKLRNDKTGNEAIIQDPAVVRESETSWTWTLDPRVKAEALKTLE